MKEIKEKAAVAKRLVTQAKFRSSCELEDWDGSFERGMSKAKLKELSLLNFFHKHENLIVVGKTGVGKTHLAIAIGKRLCQEGVATCFFSSNLLFEEAAAEKAAGRYLQWLRRCSKKKVLILDDFALRNYTHEEANILLEVLEDRYRNAITIITSQVAPLGWNSLFEDPVIAEAITDRLRNPSVVIELKGESYRKRLGS
jgi:DNA replication protein DnaC